MPLARRLTRHLGRTESPIAVHSPTYGKEISLPITLLSSTSPLSFDAPDLPAAARKAIAFATAHAEPPSPASTDTSSCPSDECDSGLNSPTPPSLTDASSLENSPVFEQFASFASPPPSAKLQSPMSPGAFAAPAIPKRVPSHSKREHERLARKRSVRSSNPALLAPPDSPAAAVASPTSPLYRPFRMEQVSEALGDEDAAADDAAYMLTRGLAVFCAADYCAEIGSPEFGASPLSPTAAAAWI